MTTEAIHTWEEYSADGKWHKYRQTGYGSGLAIKFAFWITSHYRIPYMGRAGNMLGLK